MSSFIKDELLLSDTVPGKGVCLSFRSDDIDKMEEFKGLCIINLPKALHWFHQCNSRSYQMFEFWIPQTQAMVDSAKRIADAMNLKLTVSLIKSYRIEEKIDLPVFEVFDLSNHTFDNFFG